MTTLANKGYIANEADVTALTEQILDGSAAVEGGRASYLCALVASTQKHLGAEPRLRSSKAARLDAVGIEGQLAALLAVHERFYGVVLKVCNRGKPDAKELNRRSNFARTSLSAARAWIRAGNDITALAAARVTKASLRVPRQPKPLTPGRLKSRVVKQSKGAVTALLALAEVDKEGARAEAETLIGQLIAQLEDLGGMEAVSSAARAAREHKPLRMGETMFLPVGTLQRTAVLRQ